MIQQAPSTVWEDLNAQETFDRKLLHVSVAFDQMRQYQHDKYHDLICDGTEQNAGPESTYWDVLSRRVDALKQLIENDSKNKAPGPLGHAAEVRSPPENAPSKSIHLISTA